MPDKTHGELLRELRDMVIAQAERVDNLLREGDRHDSTLNRLTESLAALTTRIAVLEHQVGDLRKTAEESGRRWWALLPPFIGALVGGIATFLGQLLFFYLRK